MARATTQQLRASHHLFSDIMLEAFAGVLVGVLYPHVSFNQMKGWLSFMILALGLTISITSLRVFGHERVVFWREAGHLHLHFPLHTYTCTYASAYMSL
jgi:hypothetical protein